MQSDLPASIETQDQSEIQGVVETQERHGVDLGAKQSERSEHAQNADVAALADHLRPVMLKLSRHLRREAQKVGVSALDAQLLSVIKKWPGAGVSDLADLEHMSRPAMSVHVKRLQAAGWLSREADDPQADRRRVRLVLSAKGASALNAIRRSRNDWLAARLAKLSPQDRSALELALEPLTRLVDIK